MFSLLLLIGVTLLTRGVVADCRLHYHDESFVPDIVLRVTAGNISVACLERYSVVVNGTSPGPEIRLREGKTSWVRVYNDMHGKNLTMHWHGLSMSVSPFSDGTPQASQWPIAPQHFFDYEIHPCIGQAGTYFYHSHVGFQAVSASGPLIVEDQKLPYRYDGERTIHLQDFFQETDGKIESGLTSIPFAWSGETNNVLVNGHGLPLDEESRSGSCSMAKIRLEPAKLYRIRFIGATALSFVSLGFQGHNNMSIIEVDGEYTKAHNVDYLQIGPGERFSVLLKSKSRRELKRDRANGIDQYFLQIETRERPTSMRAYAALIYAGASLEESPVPRKPPLTLPTTTLGWLDYKLRPLKPNNFPTLSEVTRRVTITVEQVVNNSITWKQNGFSWTESFPKAPYLVLLYDGQYSMFPSYESAIANGGMDNLTRAFPAKIGEVLEIVIQNTGSTSGGLDVHPFHAHGAHYYDIGSGNGTYDVVENEKLLKGIEPIRRDTTMLYRYGSTTMPGAHAGWRAWRLRVTTPGVWMIHCHILQHMIMGMQTVWVFGDREEILMLPYDSVKGYLTYGGDAYGNANRWPKCLHRWERD
ncbi:Cupredoxin [Lipomyces tetrasporus]|uniref:Cupredoxin n=1 Tax=Lipomyces tetrasporus TaxID=54092 RepID=A0AAD7QUX2_9ASCO|nr:Cupredoxin [Lipomyces tetrasporus]KAJ8101982.1 Cupredoxin [Lipomyces tetrasporus]